MVGLFSGIALFSCGGINGGSMASFWWASVTQGIEVELSEKVYGSWVECAGSRVGSQTWRRLVKFS